ncbi:MAG: hypothetical protein KJ555_09085, partial [Proteobacteria bacterium]|nr:hypothetical protein [Pseudomonadota bacterium]
MPRHLGRLLIVAAFLSISLSAVSSSPREQVLDDYKNGLSPGWETKSFAGHTQYTAEHDDKQFYIKATSSA